MFGSLRRVRTAPLQDVDPQRRLVLVKHEPREVSVHAAVLAPPACLSEGVGQPGAKLQAKIVHHKGPADKFQVPGLNRLMLYRKVQKNGKKTSRHESSLFIFACHYVHTYSMRTVRRTTPEGEDERAAGWSRTGILPKTKNVNVQAGGNNSRAAMFVRAARGARIQVIIVYLAPTFFEAPFA